MLLGVNSLGAIADQLGRRRGFLVSALVLGAAGLASALAPSFAVSGGAAGGRMNVPLPLRKCGS